MQVFTTLHLEKVKLSYMENIFFLLYFLQRKEKCRQKKIWICGTGKTWKVLGFVFIHIYMESFAKRDITSTYPNKERITLILGREIRSVRDKSDIYLSEIQTMLQKIKKEKYGSHWSVRNKSKGVKDIRVLLAKLEKSFDFFIFFYPYVVRILRKRDNTSAYPQKKINNLWFLTML